MSLAQAPDRLRLPDGLTGQLRDYRRQVWSTKLFEAVAAAVFGLLAAFLLMFVLDRVWETPAWCRIALFAASWVGLALLPFSIHRWVWRNRRPEQLARLLGRRHPQLGDQLLGVIELVHSDSEQARSRELCQAAIDQAAEEARKRDFSVAVPRPRRRLWSVLVAVPATLAVVLVALCPSAASNAWQRLISPLSSKPRYTFAAIEALPPTLVVPHGESFTLTVKLRNDTVWRPAQAVAQIGAQPPVSAELRENSYAFEFPAQIDAATLDLGLGDASHRLRVEPTLRPELTAVTARVELPEYLGRKGSQERDVRGGAISLVKGSSASFVAQASRDLATAEVDGKSSPISGPKVASPTARIDGSRTMEFRWQDALGLAGKAPFVLSISGRDDEPPSLSCENLPRQRVVLDTEALNFKVKARDDFGLRQVGMEWQGLEVPEVKNPARGEQLLAVGAHDKDSMDVAGAFTASSLGIAPQPINLRIFVEDYLPGRSRVYSPTYTLYVLNAEQHAVWLTDQLSKWHRQSLEVRDRELQLHEANKQLRDLKPEDLDRPETRRRIENQAASERANGRRLSNLVAGGEELVQQAMRNPEFGVGHLEKWAEMLQVLKDISSSRMPSVADLLKQASTAQAASKSSSKPPTPMAGMVRDTRSGSAPPQPEESKKATAAVPQITDRESSQQPLDKGDGKAPPPPPSGGQPRLTLPVTTLAGKAPPGDGSCPTAQKLDEAVRKQQDLLAEFEKIADELNRVLANLEGSTLVKRLKAASRLQYTVAGRVIDMTGDAFGVDTPSVRGNAPKMTDELAKQEAKGSQDVSIIMDDMQAYFERRRFMQFKSVLDEMRKLDVIGNLRQLGDDLKKENGLSIAQCEYWSDTLDRWADDLVDPISGGT